jgi:hypothetical protein
LNEEVKLAGRSELKVFALNLANSFGVALVTPHLLLNNAMECRLAVVHLGFMAIYGQVLRFDY